MDYHFNFGLIWRHFDKLSYGLLLSIELAVISVAIGCVIGLVLALLYTSRGRIVRTAIALYVETIRNTPLILLVYLVFYGLPSVIPLQYDAGTSFVITLSVYAAAYLIEIFRAGLAAIPQGIIEAGMAIGLNPWQRLLHVRLATMFRVVLPSLSNTILSLFKDTSIAAVISVPELAYGAHWIGVNTFRTIEAYLVITPMYLVAGYTILLLLRRLERRFAVKRP
jgi:polar amino acid transport system permease protein